MVCMTLCSLPALNSVPFVNETKRESSLQVSLSASCGGVASLPVIQHLEIWQAPAR